MKISFFLRKEREMDVICCFSTSLILDGPKDRILLTWGLCERVVNTDSKES